MTEMNQKPKIEEIILVNGEIINDARVEVDAFPLPGFMAIVDQRTSGVTRYVTLSSILSFSMMNTEIARFKKERTLERYLSPVATKIVRDFLT